MEPPAQKNDDRLTPSQRQAVTARGNVLVMAGAGTGKTHTLVERCLHCLCAEQPPASLEEILVVTFTEAAAAEMRQRLRERLEEKLRATPDEPRWTEQLALFDTAHIGTLHSFCLKLVREHFHELGLDPQLAVLDAGEARSSWWSTVPAVGEPAPARLQIDELLLGAGIGDPRHPAARVLLPQIERKGAPAAPEFEDFVAVGDLGSLDVEQRSQRSSGSTNL